MRRPSKDQQILEARKDLRAKQESLHLKELEYNVIENLNMKEINQMLLNQNGFVYEKIKEYYGDGEIVEKDITIDRKNIEKRRARADQYADLYLLAKRNIYQKIPQQDMKELVEQAQQNKRLMASEASDDRIFLNQKYQVLYQEFLSRQPEIEFNRRQLLQELGEVHELLSVMNNISTFEKPTIWNQEPLGEVDQKQVDELIKDKMYSVEQKFEFQDYQVDDGKEDVLKQVQEYLQENYFNKIN